MERHHRILLTTSLRSGRRVDGRGEEVGGSLLLGTLDLEEGCFHCERQIDLPESPHIRGRRSARGVSPFAGGVAVCNATEVFLFDPDLREIRATASDPRLGDIHSLAVQDGVLYVTAAAADSLLGLDAGLHPVFSWWAGEEPALDRHLKDEHREEHRAGRDFRVRGGGAWERFHVNHVAATPEGDLVVNLPYLDPGPGESKLWNVTRRRFHLPAPPGRDPDPLPGRIHDGVILESGYYLAWTQTGRFVKLCPETGEPVASVDCSFPLGTTTGSPIAARHGWLRGVLHLGGELFLVGQSRLTLFLVDMAAGTRRGPLPVHGAAGDRSAPGLAVYCMAKASP